MSSHYQPVPANPNPTGIPSTAAGDGVNPQKISSLVADFAWDYIRKGASLEDRKNRLKLACTCWNYASVPENVGRLQLDRYMEEYRKWNPEATDDECGTKKRHLEDLMEVKRKKYPNVISQIVSCDLVRGNNEERLVVAAAAPSLIRPSGARP